MTLTVQAAPMEHFPWLMERAKWVPTLASKAIEAVDASGRIHGLVAFDSWMGDAVQVHVALASPVVARALAGPVFHYAFVQAGRSVVLATIPSHNKRSLGLAWRLGFLLRGKTSAGSTREGCTLYHLEMRKESCPWGAGLWPKKRRPIGPAAEGSRWCDFHISREKV